MKCIAWILLASLLLLTAAEVCYAAHPAAGHPIAGEWHDEWHYPDANLSLGDLTFMPREDYPVFDELTQLEQYMLLGVTSSDMSEEHGLMPWRDLIFSWVNKFYLEYAYIPEQLTPDVIRSIPGYEGYSDEMFAAERNPLTGEWPMLQAAEFSPGDLYIRPLTEDEIDYFVENGYRDLQNPGSWSGDASLVRTTPVYYSRFYGYSGVLSNGFQYMSGRQ